MQFPQKFCPLYDKQVIASALWQVRINSFVWIRVKLILNCLRTHAITHKQSRDVPFQDKALARRVEVHLQTSFEPEKET